MKRIKLTQGRYAIVDDEDFEELSKYKWCARKKGANLFYAGRQNWYDGKSHIITMHQQILKAKKGQEIDHINGNGLNNRRRNIRFCNHMQNIRNQARSKNNKCGYKGVHWNCSSKKWRARINVKGKSIHLGVYFCIIAAARAYDKAAIKYFGEFARLNNV